MNLGQDCTTCRFARPTVTDDGGLVLKCHRFPPTLFLEADGEGLGQAWPDAAEWCGEHQPDDPKV